MLLVLWEVFITNAVFWGRLTLLKDQTSQPLPMFEHCSTIHSGDWIHLAKHVIALNSRSQWDSFVLLHDEKPRDRLYSISQLVLRRKKDGYHSPQSLSTDTHCSSRSITTRNKIDSYRGHRYTGVDRSCEDYWHLLFHGAVHQRYNHFRCSFWFLKLVFRFRYRWDRFQIQESLWFDEWLCVYAASIRYDIELACCRVFACWIRGNDTVGTHIIRTNIVDLQQHLFRSDIVSSTKTVGSSQWLIIFQPDKLKRRQDSGNVGSVSEWILTSGVGLPMIFAVSSAGAPSFSWASSSGMITFGGSIFFISSLVGGGALTSSGANFSGCTNGRVSIETVGRMVSLHEVSSAPDGLLARTV